MSAVGFDMPHLCGRATDAGLACSTRSLASAASVCQASRQCAACQYNVLVEVISIELVLVKESASPAEQ
jgi:hypothetical protein